MRYPGRGRKRYQENESPCGTAIEKWDTPEGDGNRQFINSSVIIYNIEKWDTPEGDGNSRRSYRDIRSYYWEMRYPGRGRKPGWRFECKIKKRLRNEIPRKGTETTAASMSEISFVLRNEIPRKGTETLLLNFSLAAIILRNEIPRKGTETALRSFLSPDRHLLRNEIPRKGTETDYANS